MARIAAMLLCAALAACTSLDDGAPAPASPSVIVMPSAADNISVYLEKLRNLLEGDAVTQADVFRTIATAADESPTTTNRLMLALALATPGHPSSNPAEAQTLLREVLASGDAMLPEEHVLALIHLKGVEQRLVSNAEADRQQRAAAAATAQRNDRSSQELQAALEENRQLRATLDEVRARLDAITNIERSIRERENVADPK